MTFSRRIQVKKQLSIASFIEKKIPLTIIEGASPLFSEKPYFDKDGLLIVNGQYPTKPYRVEFRLEFVDEESQWRLLGFNISTRAQK